MARIALATIIGTLAALAPAARSVRAQSDPGDVQAAISAADPSGCLLAIASRETGGTFNPRAENPSSGAFGLFGWLQSGGEWSATPYASIPVTVATVAEQIAAAAWSLMAGHAHSAWASTAPAGCS